MSQLCRRKLLRVTKHLADHSEHQARNGAAPFPCGKSRGKCGSRSVLSSDYEGGVGRIYSSRLCSSLITLSLQTGTRLTRSKFQKLSLLTSRPAPWRQTRQSRGPGPFPSWASSSSSFAPSPNISLHCPQRS